LISGVPVDPWLVGLHTGLYNETYTVGLWLKTNSKHQGRKKQGHCVQGDYKHFGNQTHFTIRSILFRSILYKG
jgi:hypothetical protein